MSNNFVNQSIHTRIAEELLNKYDIKYYNKNLYIYSNGVYFKDTSILEREMLKLNENITKNTRREVIEYIKIKKSGENIFPDKIYINFKNCLYDTKKQIKLEHTSDKFTLNQINANYIENININHDVEKFLDNVSSGNINRKKAILQIIGYSMTSSVELQKAFIFYGPSAENGKSTLLKIIEKLIGIENICHISIHELQKGRFYAAEMENKLLNTVAELSRMNLDTVEIFKGVVTGDEISVENKYEERHTISPYAKHIFTANEIPEVADKTNGFYRRLNILKFDKKFTEEEKRNFNIDILLTQNAIDYLASISLKAYLELMKTREFSNEKESEEIIINYKSNDKSFYIYTNESKELKDIISKYHNLIPRNKLYLDYTNFCLENDYSLIGKNTFYEKIRENNIFKDVIIQGNRYFRYLK